MTFVVNAIKQDNDVTNTYLFLLDVDSEELWRSLMKSSGMILLSIARYDHEKIDFGPFYVKVLYEWKPYEIVSSTSFNLKDLCLFFIYCGMEVIDANSFLDKLTEEQTARIITFAKTSYLEQQEKKRLLKIKKEEDEKKDKFSEDHLLKRAKISITWVLDKINKLVQDKKIHIPIKDQKWIDWQLNELKKQRMGSNYEKINTLMQDLFVFLYSLEDAYYWSIEEDWASIFLGTTVSTFDLEKQVETLEEVRYHGSFGGTVLWWRKDYVSLSILPYALFLKKDFFHLFSPLRLFVYSAFDVVLLLLVLVLVFLSWVLFFNQIFSLSSDLTSLYYSFLSLGWFALLLFLSSLFRRKESLSFLLFLLGLVIVLYYISLPILEHSFALK